MNLKREQFKLLLYMISQRRHYIPLLSIYFLTLPNTTAQQIGLYSGIGFLASFLFEIPSGYLADEWGHRKTLILAKVCMLASTTCFLLADGFALFALGSTLLSLSFSMTSGTQQAFVHDMLRGQEHLYTKVMSKIRANASIVSMVLVITLPFFSAFHITLPIILNLLLDCAGLFVILSTINPPERAHVIKQSVFSVMKTMKRGFYPFIFVISAISGIILGDSIYRYVYLESLGLPIVLMGMVMGLSRLVWFTIGHYAHILENAIHIRSLMIIEVFLFPIVYVLAGSLNNPYVVGTLFAAIIGYYWGRAEIFNNALLEYLPNPAYKATALSIKAQVAEVYKIIISFAIAPIMGISFAYGYYAIAGSIFICCITAYMLWLRTDKVLT